MPSKTTPETLDTLLGSRRRGYRSAVVAAREELRALVAPHNGDADPQVAGRFSASYLDPKKLARITPHQDHGAADRPRLEVALGVLTELLDRGDALFQLDVPKGGDLYGLLDARLAEIGRAFSAARSASLAQAGLPALANEAADLAAFPFARWSSAERGLAPALVVAVHGEDLAAEGLAAFADGNLAIGFQVSGPSGPAPLIGLVRPGTFVAQVHTPPARVPSETPVFVALFTDAPKTTALFTHTPASASASGEGIFERLEIELLPEASPTGPLGPKTQRQLQEELRQLAALAIAPGSAPAAPASAPADEATAAAAQATGASSDPIDRLAAWLLQRRQE